ncbi:hypothetical protein [Fodinicola acaciae]|uniref:hypothetical protein n=1 Tax=Fodinicola acaciae TaxID=2681555 RepID=UPI0013D69CAF|nr:hypothetical protein [Fodinicola acaciae]
MRRFLGRATRLVAVAVAAGTLLLTAHPAAAATSTSTEGEALVPGATPFQATATVQSGSIWSGGKQMLVKVDSGQTQGMISNTISLPSPSAAAYHVTALLTTGPNYGVVELKFGGHGGNYFDAYSPTTAVKTVEFTDVVVFPGSNSTTVLSVLVASKNAASSGYNAGLDKITMTLQ